MRENSLLRRKRRFQSSQALALFDFDGTITDDDMFRRFVYYATSRPRIAVGTAMLAPRLLGHRLGLISNKQMRRAVVQTVYRGRERQELEAIGERYAAEVIPQTVRPWAQERLNWHKSRGDEIVVVSASLSLYLAPWCRAQGYQLLCSHLASRGQYMTGKHQGEDCAGSEKRRLVEKNFDLATFSDVYAYGDTHEDKQLLSLASRRFYRGVELRAGEVPQWRTSVA